MKTYAPKGLHGGMLRDLMGELHATPQALAKFLRVSDRTVWRWLSDNSAPWHVLALLWHETETGRITTATDVGNALVLARGLGSAHAQAHAQESARLARLVAISDTGAANDPLVDGPHGVQDYAPRPALPAVISACETARWPCGVAICDGVF